MALIEDYGPRFCGVFEEVRVRRLKHSFIHLLELPNPDLRASGVSCIWTRLSQAGDVIL